MSEPAAETIHQFSDRKNSRTKILSKMAMLAAVSSVMSPFGAPESIPSTFSASHLAYLHHDTKPSSQPGCESVPVVDQPSLSSSAWSSLTCCGLDRLRRNRRAAGATAVKPVVNREPFLERFPAHHANSEHLASLIASGDDALHSGSIPAPLSEGLGGVYVIRNADQSEIAVFKPGDEEVGCFRNGKGSTPLEGVHNARANIEPGTCMYREAAASIIDQGFSGVPPTCLARCAVPSLWGVDEVKLGSLQTWVHAVGVSCDMGPSKFSTSDVQRIALLDIRLMNLDRHEGNILLREDSDGSIRLAPIDHGLCLPARLQVSDFEWCWMSWPQVKLPVLPEIAEYAASLDATREVELLESNGVFLPPSSIRVFRITTAFVKFAIAAGLSLHSIASAMARTSSDPSLLEKLLWRATWRASAKAVANGQVDFDTQVFVEVEKGIPSLVAALSATVRRSSW